MKTIKTLMATIAVLLCSITVSAHDFEVDGIYYTVTVSREPSVSVTPGPTPIYQGSITIPKSVTYKGMSYSVTSIGGRAFAYCTSLTSITIPNSVTSIGNHAFSGCTGLTSIIIPNSVTSIEKNVFFGCSSIANIKVDKGNPKFDSRNNCNAIIEKSTNELIAGCRNTIIPEDVTSIGTLAFGGCTGLTSITIPKNVANIVNSAFEGCTGLTSIVVAQGNPQYDSRENCNAIINSLTNELLLGCKSTKIPNTVISIGKQAFSRCSELTSITIPNSVTNIGYAAFSGCNGLVSIVVAQGNPQYDSRDNCNAIILTKNNRLIVGCKNTNIPENITKIESFAFAGHTRLQSLIV